MSDRDRRDRRPRDGGPQRQGERGGQRNYGGGGNRGDRAPRGDYGDRGFPRNDDGYRGEYGGGQSRPYRPYHKQGRERGPVSRHGLRDTANLDTTPIKTFHDAKWAKAELPKILEKMNFITPTEVQSKTIPLALAGKNVIGQSKTGTGKTLAFGTPIIDKIDTSIKSIQALVLTPTRELCLQVADVIRGIGKHFNIKVLEVYGGVDYSKQKDGLSSGDIPIVVATPGRLIDLYQQNYFTFDYLDTIVLDEADRMLDMGFFPDIEYIFDQLRGSRHEAQILLFSATIFQEIMDSIEAVTHGNHVIVRIGKNEDEFVVDKIEQVKYVIQDRSEKYDMLLKILREEKPKRALIFANTISGVEFLENRLKQDMRFPVLALSGNVSQKRREHILDMFKEEKVNHLIATDVASRGLDIPGITHVINYDVPQYPENYIHRIGRTGRLELDSGTIQMGKAITLCIQDELIYIQRIEELINLEIVTKNKQQEEEWRPRNPFRY